MTTFITLLVIITLLFATRCHVKTFKKSTPKHDSAAFCKYGLNMTVWVKYGVSKLNFHFLSNISTVHKATRHVASIISVLLGVFIDCFAQMYPSAAQTQTPAGAIDRPLRV